MEPISGKIAIPRFGESVAPCFGYSATMAIFTVVNGQVTEQTDFALQSPREMDRLRLLRDQQVDTLICGGLQDRFEDLIRAHGIRIISWGTGRVADRRGACRAGTLQPRPSPAPPPGAGSCVSNPPRDPHRKPASNTNNEEGGA